MSRRVALADLAASCLGTVAVAAAAGRRDADRRCPRRARFRRARAAVAARVRGRGARADLATRCHRAVAVRTARAGADADRRPACGARFRRPRACVIARVRPRVARAGLAAGVRRTITGRAAAVRSDADPGCQALLGRRTGAHETAAGSVARRRPSRWCRARGAARPAGLYGAAVGARLPANVLLRRATGRRATCARRAAASDGPGNAPRRSASAAGVPAGSAVRAARCRAPRSARAIRGARPPGAARTPGCSSDVTAAPACVRHPARSTGAPDGGSASGARRTVDVVYGPRRTADDQRKEQRRPGKSCHVHAHPFRP